MCYVITPFLLSPTLKELCISEFFKPELTSGKIQVAEATLEKLEMAEWHSALLWPLFIGYCHFFTGSSCTWIRLNDKKILQMSFNKVSMFIEILVILSDQACHVRISCLYCVKFALLIDRRLVFWRAMFWGWLLSTVLERLCCFLAKLEWWLRHAALQLSGCGY